MIDAEPPCQPGSKSAQASLRPCAQLQAALGKCGSTHVLGKAVGCSAQNPGCCKESLLSLASACRSCLDSHSFTPASPRNWSQVSEDCSASPLILSILKLGSNAEDPKVPLSHHNLLNIQSGLIPGHLYPRASPITESKHSANSTASPITSSPGILFVIAFFSVVGVLSIFVFLWLLCRLRHGRKVQRQRVYIDLLEGESPKRKRFPTLRSKKTSDDGESVKWDAKGGLEGGGVKRQESWFAGVKRSLTWKSGRTLVSESRPSPTLVTLTPPLPSLPPKAMLDT